ncbi:MAG: response regulator [Magnetococcales bacterium]|nr:response regulator [Magnetococcales bacterium]NGZ07473.1 response regulator [Magnetococcales bacterium]
MMNTILIVEDSSSFASLLKVRIQKALGVEVMLAKSMAETRAVLKAHADGFLLAILDLHLPDAPDGEIVDLMVIHSIPSIALTGMYKPELREIFLKKGLLDYFIKDNPRVVDSVIHTIDRVRKNRHARILVVDDSRSARYILSRFLERQGFVLLEAEDGERALQLVSAHKIHLVITDYQMPGMDGVRFIQKLRAIHVRNDVAVIGLSSHGNADLAAQFIKAGANDFLVKPYQPEELLCRVYQNIENIERYQDIVRLLDRHQAIMTHALDAIITIDGAGRVLEYNPAAEQLFGYSRELVLGRPVADFIVPEHLRAAHQSALERAVALGTDGPRLRRRMEHPGLRVNGQTIDLQISLTSVVREGEIQFTGFLQDVTDRKQLLKSLEETLAVAETANVAKSDFIANMSHEIRTPMNAVLGFTELALKAELAPRVRDYISKIENASRSLMGIISDLLDFSKLEAGHMVLDPVPFDLHLLMERLADLFSKQVADKRIELVFAIPATFDTVLFGDVIRLEQILINLIRNAVKFTEQGGITVTIAPRMVDAERVCLECMVQDSGIGVDAVILPTLFAPFVQADGSTTRRYGGTGLGLSICKRLVDLMGGRLWADSTPGEGSTFGFEVCVGIHGHNRRKRMTLPESMWGGRVLVADDHPGVRASLVGMLKELFLEPEVVSSGAEAVERLLASHAGHEVPFRHVLLDWHMPGKDGDVAAVEMRAALEAMVPKPARPVILLLAPFGVSEAISRLEKAGMDGFIDKPITRSRLIRGLSEGEEQELGGQLDRRREKLLGQEEETGMRIGGARVLLAQAGDVTPRIICEMLERVGLVVEVASDGARAVELVASYPFDAVLLDHQLPEWGGPETLSRMRKCALQPELPVIALLSLAGWEEKKFCLDSGMRDCLELPPRAERLHGLLTKWIPSFPHGLEEPEGFPRQEHVLGRIAGLDLVVGLERLGGNRVLYRRLLIRFRLEYGGLLDELRERMAAGQGAGMVVRLHALKGAARALGAVTLAEAADELEQALVMGETVLRQVALATFIQRMRVIMIGLGVGVVAAAAETTPGPVLADGTRVDREELSRLLGWLLDRLQNFSIEVEPWLAALGAMLQPTEAFFSYQELIKQIEVYHFQEAEELTRSLGRSFGLEPVPLMPPAESVPVSRVLIVDDQPSNIDLLKELLAEHHRLVAVSGPLALRAALAREPPDLILLDIMMPEMNGYEVCRQLRDNPRTRDIPVIFVTAKKQVADESEGFRLGGVDYITKPYQGEIVKRRVATHLELKRGRTALEQEIRVRTAELTAARLEAERARAEAESGNRAKSTFLAHMSHEIRTPLNAILGVNELLLEADATAEQRRYLEMARKASESLLALVNDVLDFSKIEAGQFDLERSCFDLLALITGSVEILAIQARDRGIRLSQDVEVGLPRYVLGDPNRLRQVLLNLLGNAVKFTREGEVVLTVVPDGAGRIGFAIRDTGIGIPADKLATIFQPFRQADFSTTRQYGGTGLGLSICALLVERMGGRITVESVVGQGSRFAFALDLPVADPEAPLALVSVVRQGVRESVPEEAASGERGLSILMAEDSEDNRILIRAFLKSTPHQLEFAENGAVACEKFQNGTFDIVLMDLQMPIMDGYAATRCIRNWEREQECAPTPVVALTAHAMQEASADAMAAGCDYYLSKPIAKKRLLEVLREFAGR